jgi:hypothetical protein
MDPVRVGFKETKEVLDAMIALGKAIETSMEDGELKLTDIPNFILFLTRIMPAIEGVQDVPFEFQVADPEQIAELKAYLKDELDLEDDKIEQFIEDCFKVALDIYMLISLYFSGKQPDITGDSAEIKLEANTDDSN